VIITFNKYDIASLLIYDRIFFPLNKRLMKTMKCAILYSVLEICYFFFENLWRHPFWFLDDIVKFRLKSFDWSPSVEGVNILFNFKRDLMWFFWNLKKILKLSQKKNIMLKINYLIPRWPFVDRSNRLSGFFDVGLKLAHFKLHVRNL